MNAAPCPADGHGPQWAAAVADFALRAAAAFRSGGCLTVLDMQPQRLIDAWWLRRSLEPLAHLTQRPVRYVPCVGLAPRAASGASAPAWAVHASPVELRWPGLASAPHDSTGEPWAPDGPAVVLAGDLARQLPQDILLAHQGKLQEWRGEPGAWHELDPARHPAWMAASAQAYTAGLPSSMLTLPFGYWRFLERVFECAPSGCLVLTRAPGWSSLAEVREDSATGERLDGDAPPVNFHWLAQQLPRMCATPHTLLASRHDTLQVAAYGLHRAEEILPVVCAPLATAASAPRAERARAVRGLAAGGDLAGALAVLQTLPDDPAVLRAAWSALAPVTATAPPALAAQVAAWLERLVADNPWIGNDASLLRGVGHVALGAARPDLAHTALRALCELDRAHGSDLAALARCMEQQGRYEAALSVCAHALARDRASEDAETTMRRVAGRVAAMAAPWRVQHGAEGSPLMLDPLHPAHAPLLRRQMRDPSIASMTVLPPIDEGDDGRAWIASRLNEGGAPFAIVHRQLGFVGYLDLRIRDKTAFVCYWVGADFQGRGFCAPALGLACDLAQRNGIELLVSSAFDDNARSLRTLYRCGFSEMQVRALAPDHDRTFVMRPLQQMDEARATELLVAFCTGTGSGLRFPTPVLEGEGK